MLYALMGLGLSLVTGILNIPNFAHGALFAIGAYLLSTVAVAIGNFWIALLLAPVGVALLGLADRIRWHTQALRRRPRLPAAVHLRFGAHPERINHPDGADRIQLPAAGDPARGRRPRLHDVPERPAVRDGGRGACWCSRPGCSWRRRATAPSCAPASRTGKASLPGIDLQRLFTVAFAWRYLAGIAGALTAPIRGLNPGMGPDMLGIAFVVVVLGGLGNLLARSRLA